MNQSRHYSTSLFLFLAFWGILTSTNAQTLHTITGQVMDEKGEPLMNANVYIESSMYGTYTDWNGQFVLSDITQEKISLSITFMGYEKQTHEITFGEKSIEKIKITLQPSAQSIQQVDVAGIAKGETKAMLDQKKADNIKHILSAQQIEKFPDMNAAEAIQRVTGVTLRRDQGEGRFVQLRGMAPEYTGFNINGEQIPSPEGDHRYVGMDIISADQVESIEITKVLTPDMDGDGVAGAVNIVTKKAVSEIPQFKISAAGGYNNLRETNRYNLQMSYGARKDKLGFQIDANHQYNESGSDNLQYSYAKGPIWGDTISGKDNYKMLYRDMQLRYYHFIRKRTGISATLDYRFNDKHSIYLRGMYNNFSDEQERYRKIFELEDAAGDRYTYLYGSIEHDVKARTKKQQLNTLNLGGEHDLNFMRIDYEVAYAQAKEDVPDYIRASFENPGQALEVTINRNGTSFPQPEFKNPVHDSIANDYANYEFKGLELREEYVQDINLTAKVNFTIPYMKRDQKESYIKFGAKIRRKDKSREVTAKSFDSYALDRWKYLYPSTRPADELTLPGISNGVLTNNLLNQGYTMEYLPDAQKMRDFYDFNAFLFRYGDKADTEYRTLSAELDYTASETIGAGYLMLRQNFKKLMISGGARYEYTGVDYEVKNVVLNQNEYYDSITIDTDKREHFFLLPQVQMKYSPNSQSNVRAALTYSYMRPNFNDVLPVREEDRDNVTLGNPDLIYPLSMNADLMYEHYLNHNGILAIGLYYKQIDNFIYRYEFYAHENTSGDGGPLVKWSVPLNGKEAYVGGAELQANFMFDFLPGFLSNFGVYSTYAYTYSNAIINKRIPANYSDLVVNWDEDGYEMISTSDETEEIDLPGQAEHALNLSLYYESQKFFARVSANYHSDYMTSLGADSDLDAYIQGTWHVDFNTSYAIGKRCKIFFDAVNLTNQPEVTYLGNKTNLEKQEYYSWWCRLGVKLSY